MTPGPPIVTLLTEPDCSLCGRAKEILDRVSAEGLAVVRVLDLHTPDAILLAARSQMAFPPALLIDEEPFCYGRLSERRLRRELARRATRNR
jgi:hypothetical protein